MHLLYNDGNYYDAKRGRNRGRNSDYMAIVLLHVRAMTDGVRVKILVCVCMRGGYYGVGGRGGGLL